MSLYKCSFLILLMILLCVCFCVHHSVWRSSVHAEWAEWILHKQNLQKVTERGMTPLGTPPSASVLVSTFYDTNCILFHNIGYTCSLIFRLKSHLTLFRLHLTFIVLLHVLCSWSIVTIAIQPWNHIKIHKWLLL